jgi:hypothetical protein
MVNVLLVEAVTNVEAGIAVVLGTKADHVADVLPVESVANVLTVDPEALVFLAVLLLKRMDALLPFTLRVA